MLQFGSYVDDVVVISEYFVDIASFFWCVCCDGGFIDAVGGNVSQSFVPFNDGFVFLYVRFWVNDVSYDNVHNFLSLSNFVSCGDCIGSSVPLLLSLTVDGIGGIRSGAGAGAKYGVSCVVVLFGDWFDVVIGAPGIVFIIFYKFFIIVFILFLHLRLIHLFCFFLSFMFYFYIFS